MKDTCVVRVDAACEARFYDGGGSTADIDSWPDGLRRKFRGAGVYAIRCVKKDTPSAVRVVIIGLEHNAGVPALFTTGYMYGICSRFLRELGVTPPPKDKRKTLHLIVMKRKAKK